MGGIRLEKLAVANVKSAIARFQWAWSAAAVNRLKTSQSG
jgi:hypothetical protein